MESNDLTGPPAENPAPPTRKRSRSEMDAEEEEELLGDRDGEDGYGRWGLLVVIRWYLVGISVVLRQELSLYHFGCSMKNLAMPT